MHSLETSFNANGRFTDEEISSYFADPDESVQYMILGSTDPDFRKACMLAILDNNPFDKIKIALGHPDFRPELQAILDETRKSLRVKGYLPARQVLEAAEESLCARLLPIIEQHLQKLRSDPSPNHEYIKTAESLRDHLLENKFRQIRNNP
jgi:hypothetical protein